MTYDENLTKSLYAEFNRRIAKTDDTSTLTSGESLEEVLRNVIRKTAPSDFAVGEGFIENYTEKSKQIDILIWNRGKFGTIEIYDDRILRATVKPESIRAIIEVKSEFKYDYLKDSLLAVNDRAYFIINNNRKLESVRPRTIENFHKFPSDLFTGVFFCNPSTSNLKIFEKNLTNFFNEEPKIEEDIIKKLRNRCKPVKYFVFGKDMIAIYNSNSYDIYYTKNKSYNYFLSLLDRWLNVDVNEFYLLNNIIKDTIEEEPIFSIDFRSPIDYYYG